MPVDRPLYGASIPGVQPWVPTFTIRDDSQPNATAVEAFLVFTSRWVANRLGHIEQYSTEIQELTTENARGLVELGAASLTYNAAHPQNAGKAGSSYGDELWAMFLKGIDEALEALGKMVDEGKGPVDVTPDVGPAAYFPFPRSWRDQGF